MSAPAGCSDFNGVGAAGDATVTVTATARWWRWPVGKRGWDCCRRDGCEVEGRSDDEVELEGWKRAAALVGGGSVGAFGPSTSYIRVRRCWAISFRARSFESFPPPK